MAGRPEFRASQGVVPFGVGAITDFPDESLMMAGLDVWPHETADGEVKAQILEATKVVDGRLARRLSANLKRRIDVFRSPTIAPNQGGYAAAAAQNEGTSDMPFVRFPNWHFCPRCRVLVNLPWNAQRRESRLRCSNMGRRVKGKGEPCGELSIGRRFRLVPVRFVVACEHGHIMDFPWTIWAHSRSEKECDGGSGDLYIYSTPAAGLAGVIVACIKCGSKRSMAGSFRKDMLKAFFVNDCTGDRPWLGPNNGEPKCLAVPQTIQRGASNAYFAKVVSSILIPPYSAALQQAIEQPELWADISSLPKVDGRLPEDWIRRKGKRLGFDPEVFVKAVKDRLDEAVDDKDFESAKEVSEEEYRIAEYKAFKDKRPPKQERHDFDIQAISVDQYSSWFGEFFERVILVKKLRETRVLTGFSRIVPPEALDNASAALSVKPLSWLPGFSVRGEGIFLELRKEKLQAWKGDNSALKKRVRSIKNRLRKLEVERGIDPRSINAEVILIHTLAHLLIRQMSFDCGYDSSSLRERLYVSSDDSADVRGFLIYTASGDSEGTLGGLVRQGKPGRLDETMKAALENAEICSSDPLCIESDGQGTYGLNMAACHACCLLPETSCEEGNTLLDRALVSGSPDHDRIGYFSEIHY